uniref:Uncharacterized protein n=1 Tax=Nelumbo nucifera TaxID=4432 RepID=A0A822Z8B3_NELNU|nr:TPA_asm: hypothetical protein HUJ06_015163 [Nelumbo nucifera]
MEVQKALRQPVPILRGTGQRKKQQPERRWCYSSSSVMFVYAALCFWGFVILKKNSFVVLTLQLQKAKG